MTKLTSEMTDMEILEALALKGNKISISKSGEGIHIGMEGRNWPWGWGRTLQDAIDTFMNEIRTLSSHYE